MKSLIWILRLCLVYSFSTIAMAQDHGGGDHGGGHGDAGLKVGRYVGDLSVPSSGKRILATLDLFVSQDNGDFPKLEAILKVNLGGYSSPEYVAYAYDKVMYDPDKMELTFDFEDQDVLISKLMIHGEHLMGDFRSVSSSTDGKVSLMFQAPTAKLMPPMIGAKPSVSSLSGEYKGTCGGKEQLLQLEVTRSLSDSTSVDHAFGQYDIHGRQTTVATGLKETIYNSGSYNFYAGELLLYGFPSNLQCAVSGDDLSCGACQFKKVSGLEELFPFQGVPLVFENKLKIDDSKYMALPNQPTEADLTGQYFGYLFHESTNRYQAMRFDVTAFKNREGMHTPNQLSITSVANLYFGDFDSIERIPLKFNARPWLVSDGAMRVGDGESFGVIRSWKQGLITMDWFSRNYGRVGTVQLVLGEKPARPEGVNLIPSLSGNYISPLYHLQMSVGPNGEGSDEVHNAFHPLSLFGYYRLQGNGPYNMIERGAYDFYSGYVWIEGRDESRFIGRVDDQALKLFYTGFELIATGRMLKRNFSEYQLTP